MATSDADIQHVHDLLAGFGPVEIRRLFGGAGIYADGVMFGLVAGSHLYLRTDARTSAAFAAEGSEPFVARSAHRSTTMPYWRVPERLLDDPDDLADWARTALDVARAAVRRRSPPKSRKRE